MPPILSIVSKKRSGKTTLIEKLIPALQQLGFRVGTVKHDTHGFEIDHEGKDTWRHKKAGARTVAISSPWKVSLIRDVDQEVDLERIVEDYFGDMDIVITEGYKWAQKPQIEVFRSQVHSTPPVYPGRSRRPWWRVMSDVPVDLGVPRFDIDDIEGLAVFIQKEFLTANRA